MFDISGFETCSPSDVTQNLPGASFFVNALGRAFSVSSTAPPDGIFDYTGQTNLAMRAKWQELSTTTAPITNLIWTNIATNAVMPKPSPNATTPNPLSR
jgi:hypothetical protein